MGGQCGDSQNPFCSEKNIFAPEEFCCPKGDSCLLTAANTTVICCPPGSDCTLIAPIQCDLGLEKFPGEVQSIVREGQLPECDDQCCPWGYFCNQDDVCEISPDQTSPPPAAESSSSKNQPTGHPTSTSTIKPGSSSTFTLTSLTASGTFTAIPTTLETQTSSVGTPQGNQTVNQPAAIGPNNKGAWIAIGSFFGVAVGVLVAYSILRVYKSRKSRDCRDKESSGTSELDQGGVKEPESPDQPDSPYDYEKKTDGHNVYELPG
ncbi:hypothetical protein F5Y13DRAFT_199435 [Hypoxylon sp. FL1857]|nr:hypothetical protein F5Y13DRAFT_199435 [Hypoxylon sp. FL1857]